MGQLPPCRKLCLGAKPPPRSLCTIQQGADKASAVSAMRTLHCPLYPRSSPGQIPVQLDMVALLRVLLCSFDFYMGTVKKNSISLPEELFITTYCGLAALATLRNCQNNESLSWVLVERHLMGTWDHVSHPVGHVLWMIAFYWTLVPPRLKFSYLLRPLNRKMAQKGERGSGCWVIFSTKKKCQTGKE